MHRWSIGLGLYRKRATTKFMIMILITSSSPLHPEVDVMVNQNKTTWRPKGRVNRRMLLIV